MCTGNVNWHFTEISSLPVFVTNIDSLLIYWFNTTYTAKVKDFLNALKSTINNALKSTIDNFLTSYIKTAF